MGAEQLKTPDDVAGEFKVTKAAIYRWVAEGKLRPVRVGSLLRFTDESIREFLARSASRSR
jgi:excisionase family DNA binding protein